MQIKHAQIKITRVCSKRVNNIGLYFRLQKYHLHLKEPIE